MSSLIDVCRFNATSSGTGDFIVSSAATGYQTPASAGAVNGATYSYRAENPSLSEWEVGFGTYTTGTTTLARSTVLYNSAGNTSKINFSTAPQVAGVALAADIGNPVSSSFTATLTGCTTSPTMTVNYAKVGRVVTLSASGLGGITGTSNATAKTLTGMPASLYPVASTFFLGSSQDNGGAFSPSLCYVTTGGVLTLLKDMAGSGFTASGTFGFYFMTISYVAAS